jgi:cobalt-zinc-cadmium efflux system membrane fusion protein
MKIRLTTASVAAVSLLVLLALVLIGCGKTESSTTVPANAETDTIVRENGDPGQAAGTVAQELNAPSETASWDQALNTPCEHAMPTYQCDECRYEAGVVKLSPALIKDESTGKGLVKTAQATRIASEAFLEVTGEIQYNENAAVHVTPRVTGIISSVRVDVGAKVKKGDVLFEMESVELGEAMAAYLKSRTLTDLSRKTYERKKALFEQKISSESALIEAQMTYEEHKSDLDQSEQQLHVLGMPEAEIQEIQPGENPRLSGRLPFRAPLDGIIVEKHAAVGNLIQPGDMVMLLADLSTVWVWLDIYEQDLSAILSNGTQNHPQATVETNAFPGRLFTGEINYVGAAMNEETRTVKLRANLNNPENLLRPGMFCKARIAQGTGEEVLAVARAAVLSDEGNYFVFKHLKDNYYVRCPVKKGREFASIVEISEGLQAGETIVIEGAFLLKSDVLREKMGAGCAD